MHHPFQGVAVVGGKIPFLLAASGSSLLSVNLSDGTIAGKWEPEGAVSLDPLGNVGEYSISYTS
jgi:hypothetical protein